jgi:S1-C subfamily serine protease
MGDAKSSPETSALGVTRFNETGSGVLISGAGRVRTAARVVNGMDEITVKGIAGEVVRAKLISSSTPPISRSCSSP